MDISASKELGKESEINVWKESVFSWRDVLKRAPCSVFTSRF